MKPHHIVALVIILSLTVAGCGSSNNSGSLLGHGRTCTKWRNLFSCFID
jgi:hypothetical protein